MSELEDLFSDSIDQVSGSGRNASKTLFRVKYRHEERPFSDGKMWLRIDAPADAAILLGEWGGRWLLLQRVNDVDIIERNQSVHTWVEEDGTGWKQVGRERAELLSIAFNEYKKQGRWRGIITRQGWRV